MQVILAQRRTTSGTQCRPSRIGNRPLPPRARPVRLCEIPYHESRGTGPCAHAVADCSVQIHKGRSRHAYLLRPQPVHYDGQLLSNTSFNTPTTESGNTDSAEVGLTIVRQRPRDMTIAIARKTLDLIKGRPVDIPHESAPLQLLIHNSTAAPRITSHF